MIFGLNDVEKMMLRLCCVNGVDLAQMRKTPDVDLDEALPASPAEVANRYGSGIPPFKMRRVLGN